MKANRSRKISFLTVMLLLWAMACLAQYNNVRIEMRFEKESLIDHHTYFVNTDVFTGKERKVESVRYDMKTWQVDFRIDYPIYDELIQGGTIRYPFYVEPGDTLIMNIGRGGKVTSYEHPDGKRVKCLNLMLHDISNSTFYTHEDFERDKHGKTFGEFATLLEHKMDSAVALVNVNADKHRFSDAERTMAVNNVRMQFGVWLFEFPEYMYGTLSAYARNHPEGWETHPQLLADIESIEDAQSYSMLRSIGDRGTSSLPSRYFPWFLRAYQHSHYLNHDQSQYLNDAASDTLNMDSDLLAKDCLLMGNDTTPSLFAQIIVARRHYQVEKRMAQSTDGSVLLDEVKVEGLRGLLARFPYYELDYDSIYNQYWDPNLESGGITSPLTYFANRRRIRNFNRAKDIIRQLEADDNERDLLLKAYEEETGRKKQ